MRLDRGLQRRQRLEHQGLPRQVAAISAALLALALAAPARAATGRDMATARTLGLFNFQSPTLADPPWTTSHVGIDTSFQSATIGSDAPNTLPSMPLPRRKDSAIALFEERLSFGLRPVPGVELGARGSFYLTSGGDPTSIYAYGGGSRHEVRPYVAIEAVRNDAYGLIFGVRAGASFSSGMRYQPAGLVSVIVQEMPAASANTSRLICLGRGDLGCAFPNVDGAAAMSVDEESRGGFIQASAAKGFGRHAGLSMALGGEIASLTTTTLGKQLRSAPGDLYGALALSFDAFPHAPIGAALEARVDRGYARLLEKNGLPVVNGLGQTTTAAQFAGGVYYTGRAALGLGLIGTYSSAEQIDALPGGRVVRTGIRTYGGRISMRYFF